ncbi:MAG: hypothetical protein ACRC3B_01075 [Bacteroidia bacterium]
MTTAVLKKQLLKKIDQIRPQDLKLIDVLLDQLLKQNEEETNPEAWLTAEQLKDLDNRTKLLNSGDVELYCWTDVKNKVRKASWR